MSRGELLAALDAAPAGLRTLQATVRRWTHLGRQQAPFERADAADHGPRTAILMATSDPGDRMPETTESVSRVWFAAPARWRVETDGALFLSDGDQRWEGFSHFVTERGSWPSVADAPTLGDLLLPGVLLGGYRLDEVTEAETFGRASWTATATARAVPRHGSMAGWGPFLQGHDPCVHRLVVDAEHGFILAHTALLDGEPAAVVDITDLAVDAPIADSTFRPPPTATIQTEADERARLLREAGVDPETVDSTDPAAVSQAMRGAYGLRATGQARPGEMARHFVPWGPPPDDEAAAERDIRTAFRRDSAASENGRDLVNVQAGDGLVEPTTLAGRRAPGVTSDDVTFAVDALRFVCPDEAVVWFSLEIDGEPSPLLRGRRGRAVRVDGRWLIERGTIAELLAFAGVQVPPPPD
ncbi:MAG TPA: hypothetical protein VFZ79_08065 [Acidimicrobiales bacterium]